MLSGEVSDLTRMHGEHDVIDQFWKQPFIFNIQPPVYFDDEQHAVCVERKGLRPLTVDDKVLAENREVSATVLRCAFERI